MQKKPVFHLFIPYLFQSLKAWHQDFLFDVNATHLSMLLTQCTKIKTNKRSLDERLFKTLNTVTKELPVAFFRHQIQVGEKKQGLICADPVYLEVGMNDVILSDKITDLTNNEAKELIDVLNNHFAQDELQFIFGSNQNWYISFPEDETVQTHDLDSVFLTNITDKVVQSEQRNWQIIQNETQMLLHSSDINQQREIAGLKPVNSLWFWGAGKPLISDLDVETIYSSNVISSKLRGQLYAEAANCKWEPLPESAYLLEEQINKKTGNQILVLDHLFMPSLENELDEFQRQLTHIDQNIIKPLLQAWQKNEIDIIIDCCDGAVLKPEKVPAWKFWIKPKGLREISG